MALDAQREIEEMRILGRCQGADSGCVWRETERLNQQEARDAELTLSLMLGFYARPMLAVGLGAPRGFEQARGVVSRVASSLGRTGGRSGRRVDQFEGSGGARGAQRLFDELTGGNSSATQSGGRVGRLQDGTSVQMSSRIGRDGSVQTSVRIERTRPDSRIRDQVKVRFVDPAP
jgi:hypothetical protein